LLRRRHCDQMRHRYSYPQNSLFGLAEPANQPVGRLGPQLPSNEPLASAPGFLAPASSGRLVLSSSLRYAYFETDIDKVPKGLESLEVHVNHSQPTIQNTGQPIWNFRDHKMSLGPSDNQ